MLESYTVQVDGVAFTFGDTSNESPGKSIRLGIYDTKGVLAAAHNEGLGRMPRREFWSIGSADRDTILSDIQSRVVARMKAKL
jgi:hypothetical protein